MTYRDDTHTDPATDPERVSILEFDISYTDEGTYYNPIPIELDFIPVLGQLPKLHRAKN